MTCPTLPTSDTRGKAQGRYSGLDLSRSLVEATGSWRPELGNPARVSRQMSAGEIEPAVPDGFRGRGAPDRAVRVLLRVLLIAGFLILIAGAIWAQEGSPPQASGPEDGHQEKAAPPEEEPPSTTDEKPSHPAETTSEHPPSAEELKQLIAEQARQIEELKQIIERQRETIARQEGDLDAQGRRLEEMERLLESMTRRLDELQQELPSGESRQAIEERLKRVEESSERVPELPPDVVSAGDFPGSIRIPGTDAAVKFGARFRVAIVSTLDPLGSGDRFLTNSIPVEGTALVGEGKQTNINANTSRLNFEFRTPTGGTHVRGFVEGDFFGSGNSFRLRHAYGQYHGFLFGQTWSTFSDPEADHEDLDFEGVSSENVIRQPQIRYGWRPREGIRVAAAMETPQVSVTGGTGSDVVPDVIGQFYWRFKKVGHLQVAGVVREIRAAPLFDPSNFQREWGWGVSLSGVVPFHYWDLTDRFLFQLTAGRGIARYVNDLSSLGGQDAVFDPATGTMETLPAFGWYVDYEHMWKRLSKAARGASIRSSLIWSAVVVDNADFQPADAYHLTHRFAANLIVSPISRLDVGVQYIYGRRENNDGSDGTARQVQFVAILKF